MKVLLIDVNYKYSSTGKIVYDLYSYINDSGDMAAVAYGRGPHIHDNNVYKFSNDVEMYLHALLTRLTGLTGCYSFFATRKLIRIMKKLKPDVVHIHELHAYFVNLAPVIKYLNKNNIKTIWTFHCEFMYTGKCGYTYDCDKWKSECEKCPQLSEYPKSLFFDFTNRMFHKKKQLFEDFNNLIIVTPSNWLADRVKQSFLSNKDIRVIYNGIDTDNVFYPRVFENLKMRHNIRDEKIVLAIAPDLMSDRKGGQWVVKLANKCHNDNIKFILIGVNDKDTLFDHNIIAIGRTTNQIELAEYYSMADITLVLSSKETFSLVCAESIACGTPVIGFESGAPSEIIPKGYGTFVPYGNLEMLYQEVKAVLTNTKVLKSEEECASYGKRAFDKNIMAKNYFSLY